MAWTTLSDAETASGQPITQSMIRALRDNPSAIAGGLTGAPEVVKAALAAGAVDGEIIRQAASGTGHSVAWDKFEADPETAGSPTKVLEYSVGVNGTCSISFTLSIANATATAYGRIYVNGSASGTLRTTSATSATWMTEEDIALSDGDLLQIYAYSSNASYGATAGNVSVRSANAPVGGVFAKRF